MPFNEALAQRIRDVLATRDDVEERRMFGGITFLVAGHMACGVVGVDLMVRIGDAVYASAVQEPHARAMDFTGRPMRGMVYVAPAGIASAAALRKWVGRALSNVAALPKRLGPARAKPTRKKAVAKRSPPRARQR